MNSALELHDSEVQKVAITGNELRILFSKAYIHKSERTPGIDPGAGYIQPAECIFSGADWVGLSSECSGILSDGLLVIEDRAQPLIALPLVASGRITAEFVFSSGAALLINARAVEFFVFGEEHFVENYA